MGRNWIALGLLTLLVAACQTKGVFDPGWERAVGQVDPALSSVQMITAPTSARVNVPFTVTVRTLGRSPCTRAADMDVVVSGLNVDITPYDEYARTSPYCRDDLKAFEHTASVTVGTAGQARVRLHARTLAGADYTYDAAVTVQP